MSLIVVVTCFSSPPPKKTLNCSSANCTCDPDTGATMTTSPINQSCGCGCTAHNCSCECARSPCSCDCTKTCGCNCSRNTCNATRSDDGKTYNSTGGLDCSVQAYCDHGFYAGGDFTAYKTTGAVVPHLHKDGTLLGIQHLSPITSYYDKVWNSNSGLHRFSELKVINSASYTKQYALYFTTGSEISLYLFKSVTTATFSLRPKSIVVRENMRSSAGRLSNDAYLVGASLGSYSISLSSFANNYLTAVEPEDGFKVTASLVTGKIYLIFMYLFF